MLRKIKPPKKLPEGQCDFSVQQIYEEQNRGRKSIIIRYWIFYIYNSIPYKQMLIQRYFEPIKSQSPLINIVRSLTNSDNISSFRLCDLVGKSAKGYIKYVSTRSGKYLKLISLEENNND